MRLSERQRKKHRRVGTPVLEVIDGVSDPRLAAAIEVMDELMATRATRTAWLLGFLAGSGVAADQPID